MSRRSYGDGSITKRGPDVFLVRYSDGRDPATGRRRRRSFTVHGNRSQARQALRAAVTARDTREQPREEPQPEPNATLGEVAMRWLPRHAALKNLKPRTRLRYRQVIENEIGPELGHLPLNALSFDSVESFLARQLTGRSSSTVHQEYVILMKVLKDAAHRGYAIDEKVFEVPPPVVAPPAESRALNPDEVRLLLRACANTALACPVGILVICGLRLGELLGLRWEDVVLDSRLPVLTVNQSLGYVPGEGLLATPPKTDRGHRRVELTGRAAVLLQEHRCLQTLRARACAGAKQLPRLVFPSAVGTYWHPSNFERAFEKAVARSGIETPPAVTPHTLRHTAITKWINAGADILTVSRRAGHLSAAFTIRRYGHAFAGMQEVAARAFDDLFD